MKNIIVFILMLVCAVALAKPFNIPNQPPKMIGLMAEELSPGTFRFTGAVWDEAPVGLTVTFGGVLKGKSTVTGANGAFSFVSKAEAGTATGSTKDKQGLVSNTVTVDVSPTPP